MPEETFMLKDPQGEGYEARANEVPIHENPYPFPSIDRQLWNRGWEEADKHVRAMTKFSCSR